MDTTLDSLVAQFDTRAKPPVENWKPERTSAIDIRIDRQGCWYYQGSSIERSRMVALFSTILWREENEYFLITPQEKLRIEVEDAPFVAMLMDVNGSDQNQSLRFTDNTGNQFHADTEHRLWLSQSHDDQPAPYVMVRRNLPALLSRAVYYQLAELLVEYQSVPGVWSEGVFFEFGTPDDS